MNCAFYYDAAQFTNENDCLEFSVFSIFIDTGIFSLVGTTDGYWLQLIEEKLVVIS